MPMKTYAEKLKDPRWQKRRLEIMQRDEFTCRHCRSKEDSLNVHHRLYSKGKSPWDYPDHLLVTLCENCHAKAETTRACLLGIIGVNPKRDQILLNLAQALHSNPVELTFFGWALESMNEAMCMGYTVYDKTAEDPYDAKEMAKEAIRDCIENLMRAQFNIETTLLKREPADQPA